MSLPTRRGGIERKILTSILWVGIWPMTVALIVGYVSARSGQSNAVQQTLLSAAYNTAKSIELLSQERLRDARKFARHPAVIATLASDMRGVAGSDAVTTDLLQNLTYFADHEHDGLPIIALYNAAGEVLATSRPEQVIENLPEESLGGLDEPRYEDFVDHPDGSGFLGVLILSPVMNPETGDVLGYVSMQTGIDSIMRGALGITAAGEASGLDYFQLIAIDEQDGDITVVRHRDDDSGRMPLDFGEPDQQLIELLESEPSAGATMLPDYLLREELEQDVILAYQRLHNLGLPGQTVYLVVSRPSALVFSDLNMMAGLALVGGILFIAFLCVNAYRDVHNNIVRPISLLNEGAQIIRQGDFDLKLKIGTGDEIEELAHSFNKMALALKANIHQLEESEAKYRTLVTAMRDGVYRLNREGRITYLNPRAVDILGFSSLDEAMGVVLKEFFQDSIDFIPNGKSAITRQGDERTRCWLNRRDGQTICVEISAAPIINGETGETEGVEGIFRDVTRQVKLEEEAQERSERISAINQIANAINSSLEAGRLYESLVVELRQLVHCDYAAVVLVSETGGELEGRQLYPDQEQQPGYTFTLDKKKSCAAWVARERKPLVLDDLQGDYAVFAEEFPTNIHSVLCVPLHATGRIIGTLHLGRTAKAAFTQKDVDTLEQMANHIAVAIRNAQLLVNLQLSLEEVTRAQEKLHAANEELKTLDELKTNLLSNVSHELRTPLVSVMGYTDMILNEKAGPVNDTQREYLGISLRNVEKLVTLIENLLDFSRLHRGDEKLLFDTFDLVECARSGIQIVKPVADSRNIKVELIADAEPIWVDGDKGKLGQVFNNLLSNAVKFNDSDGEVRVELKVGEEWVEVIVSDTGIGIPAEALEKVFTRFYQYDTSSTRKYGGTGIGLSIAQDIVRLHGSSITVSSTHGNGSVFRFRLRLSETKTQEGAAATGTSAPSDTNLLVLIVSESRQLSAQIRYELQSEPINIMHASTPDTAVSLAKKHHPDCILVDASPNTKGEQVLTRLAKDAATAKLPVVIFTDEDELYRRHRKPNATRVSPAFRKSSLLSGIYQVTGGATPSVEAPEGNRVLCVDDEDEILMFMRRVLEPEGFAVETCKSGEQALEKLPAGDYGLVLLDIAMPGMNGWETCRKIREDGRYKNLRIYMVTAKPLESNIAKIYSAGADGWLQKPFKAEDLLRLVHGLEIRAVAK